MANTRGIFTLSQVQTKQRYGEFVPSSDVFIGFPDVSVGYDTGYFGGGLSPSGHLSIMDKTNFADDTTSYVPGANLSVGRSYPGGAGNSNNGYFGGGQIPGPTLVSTMDKVDYSSDTTAEVPGAALSGARYYTAATGNSRAGYIGGGNPGPLNTMDKCTYSSDTTAAVPTANLSVSRYVLFATGNQGAGYFTGGYSHPNNISTTDKLNYYIDTTAAVPAAKLSLARYSGAGASSSTAAYFGGGYGAPIYSTTDKLTYSTDTTAEVPGAALSIPRYAHIATGNSTAAYFGGGLGPSDLSTLDKLTYADETAAILPSTADLSHARYGLSAVGSRSCTLPSSQPSPFVQLSTGNQVAGPNTGYAVGGRQPSQPTNPGSMSIVDKIDYGTDTLSAVGPTPNPSDNNGITNSSTDLYSAGGYPTQVGTLSSIIYKVTYSSDTAGTAPNLTVARYATGGLSSPSNGYYSGGGPGFSLTDRLVFSSDSVARIPSADLPVPSAYRGGMAGNTSRGYFALGTSGGQSQVFKLDYISEFYSSLPTSTFPFSGSGSVAAGDMKSLVISTFNVTNFQKLVYSTETGQQIPSAPKPELGMQLMGASSNSDGAYFSGGYYPSITAGKSDTIKLSYGTDTVENLPASNLSAARYSLSGGGARSSGTPQPPAVTPTPQTIPEASDATMYSASGPSISSFEKFTTVTETASAIPGANTSVNGSTHTTFVGSKTDGFVSGGVNTAFSGTDKIVYSSDSVSRVPGMDMIPSTNAYFYAATPVATESLGYLMGGVGPSNPGNESFVQKLDYSAETAGRVPTADMPSPRRYGNNIGSTTNGYLVAGSQSGSGVPTVMYTDTVKLNYSTESCSALPASPLPTWGTSYSSGTGVTNPSHGYLNAPQPSSKNSTSIFKFTLSSETSALAPGATLSAVQYACKASGDHTSGYFGGGRDTGFGNLTTMTKVTFSTDTSSNSPGNLTVARQRHSSRSTADQGMPAPTIGIPVIC